MLSRGSARAPFRCAGPIGRDSCLLARENRGGHHSLTHGAKGSCHPPRPRHNSGIPEEHAKRDFAREPLEDEPGRRQHVVHERVPHNPHSRARHARPEAHDRPEERKRTPSRVYRMHGKRCHAPSSGVAGSGVVRAQQLVGAARSGCLGNPPCSWWSPSSTSSVCGCHVASLRCLPIP